MPQRPRRLEAVDHDQHLLDVRPVPMQRHRIAARGPGIAETDHAADVFQTDRGVDDRQREDDVLAGVHRAILSQNDPGRNAARDHRRRHDLAFRKPRPRRDPAADDGPAKIAAAPEPRGFRDALVDILAGAEHEQEIGRLQRGVDQMLRIDRGNFVFARQSHALVGHGSSSGIWKTRRHDAVRRGSGEVTFHCA